MINLDILQAMMRDILSSKKLEETMGLGSTEMDQYLGIDLGFDEPDKKLDATTSDSMVEDLFGPESKLLTDEEIDSIFEKCSPPEEDRKIPIYVTKDAQPNPVKTKYDHIFKTNFFERKLPDPLPDPIFISTSLPDPNLILHGSDVLIETDLSTKPVSFKELLGQIEDMQNKIDKLTYNSFDSVIKRNLK